jgi:4-aminobutyrate aminotransferase-like enzyme
VGRLGGDPTDAAAVAATLQPAELAQLDHLVRRVGVAAAARVVAAHATHPGPAGVRGACRLAAVRLGWTRWLGR